MRFKTYKGETGKWIVEDTKSDPAEDAGLYFFPSKKKAGAFEEMMIAEHGNS